MNIIGIGVPQKITTPIGFHNALVPVTIGRTPMVAAADVRKIGRILRFEALSTASCTG